MEHCTNSSNTTAAGWSVKITPFLFVEFENDNMVPATVSSWTVDHTFYCSAGVIGCIAGGSEMGTNRITLWDWEGNSEINRKSVGNVTLDDNHTFTLSPCKMGEVLNGTYCEWL